LKLKKFTEFSKTILPNEAKYLEKRIRFVDAEKCDIIKLLISNALPNNNFKAFNVDLDKRKYTYIKSWVLKQLRAIDVDVSINWILSLKNKILTDIISPKEESDFLMFLSDYDKELDFNFQSIFELAKDYKPYLLVRMRYKDHKTVSIFLETYESFYVKSKKIHRKLYQATIEITNQYTLNKSNPKYWEKWLNKIFNTKEIDGRNRYNAFVLLAFLFTNNNQTSKLENIFNLIDDYFNNGELYSRRLLSNYYASRVLLHSKQNEFNKAEYYALLSIRQHNNDTLMYTNNLVAILLKNRNFSKAQKILDDSLMLFKSSPNNHQRVGYISYKIRVLTELGHYKLAEETIDFYLKTNAKEILKYRWHHFFTSAFNLLIKIEKYGKLLKICNRYSILEEELLQKSKPNYIPNILWSIFLSKYMEENINETQLLDELEKSMILLNPNNNDKKILLKVLNQFSNNLPNVFHKFKSHFI